MARLRFAMVCASNMNRSMEAHFVLQRAGFEVGSYGVGRHVKLPGPAADKPNIYDFGTPYESIESDLIEKDSNLYTSNGLLEILARNKKVKRAPERWQLQDVVQYDVVLCFEQRVVDALLEDMFARKGKTNRPILVVNINVKDNAVEAKRAGQEALKMCKALEDAGEDWMSRIEAIMDEFFFETQRRPTYSVVFG